MVYLIGNKGMLGSEIERILHHNSMPYYTSDKEIDLCNEEQLFQYSQGKSPNWVVNCAAYTAVDKAEEDTEIESLKVNSFGAGNAAHLAREKNAGFIHISTDYVFDGKNTLPYQPKDNVNPQTRYGMSKAEGEIRVRENHARSIILRTSWLYGKNGSNFVDKMLELFRFHSQVRVVNDQTGNPTYSKDLAEFIVYIIRNNYSFPGTYHFTNSGGVTWYEFACEIYRMAAEMLILNKNVEIIPIKTEEYPVKAERPPYSVLDTTEIKTQFDYAIRDWKSALYDYLKSKITIPE